MPAARAMVSVEAPCMPRSANSTIAAASTASRRSAAVLRAVETGAMRWKLSVTYKSRQDPGDAIELVLRQPSVEGQRKRALEGAVGAGERPLLVVGLEPVQRVR